MQRAQQGMGENPGVDRAGSGPIVATGLAVLGVTGFLAWAAGASPVVAAVAALAAGLAHASAGLWQARGRARQAAATDAAFAAGLEDVVALRPPAVTDAAARGSLRLVQDAIVLVLEQRRRAEASQLSAELALDRVLSALEALGEGVAVVDTAGEVVLTNPSLSASLRDPRASALGSVLWDALHPDLAPRVREAWWRLRHGPSPDGEVRLLGVACGDRQVDVIAVPARSSRSGQDFGIAFLLVDSTRTHEVARLKDDFLSCLSHELRTPLTNICAYAEILRHILPGEAAEWPEFVRIVHEEGVRLSRLVDGLFDYLQLENGTAIFRCAPCSAVEVARTAVQDQTPRAEAAGIGLRWVVEGSPPDVSADARRLRQTLDQLLDNAIKFTPKGGRIRVTVAERDGACVIRVDDSGHGVPPTRRGVVFDRFQQLGRAGDGKPAGIGIGLATCRAIVRRLGGVIRCEESPLGGACFMVELPRNGAEPLRAERARAFAEGP